MAAEIACDEVDNDCDGALHADDLDNDLDGYDECEGDCDDGDPAQHLDDLDGEGLSPSSTMTASTAAPWT